MELTASDLVLWFSSYYTYGHKNPVQFCPKQEIPFSFLVFSMHGDYFSMVCLFCLSIHPTVLQSISLLQQLSHALLGMVLLNYVISRSLKQKISENVLQWAIAALNLSHKGNIRLYLSLLDQRSCTVAM